MHVLLLVGATTQLINDNVRGGNAPQWAEDQGQPRGQPTTEELVRQHAASGSTQSDTVVGWPVVGWPVVGWPVVGWPVVGWPVVSSPTSLPLKIYDSAGRGELQKVTKWLRNGGPVDALGLAPCPTDPLKSATFGLLHAAAHNGQLEMVRELLKRGASVDLQGSTGYTALMHSAYHGHLSIVLLLLQHSAYPDLQSNTGATALMTAAHQGQRACVQALLRAGANTELRTKKGNTASLLASARGHTATAKLLRQDASCLSLGLSVALCVVLALTWPWVVLSVVVVVGTAESIGAMVLGAIATVA